MNYYLNNINNYYWNLYEININWLHFYSLFYFFLKYIIINSIKNNFKINPRNYFKGCNRLHNLIRIEKYYIKDIISIHKVKVEVGVLLLWPQYSAKPLSFFLSRSERPGHLDCHWCVGEIDGEVGDLGNDYYLNLPFAEDVVYTLALRVRGLAGD